MGNKSNCYNSDNRFTLAGCYKWGAEMMARPHVWGRTAIISIVAVFLFHNMPMIEGKISPVTTVLNIEVIEDTKNGWAVVSGSFTKNRDCTFDRIQWFWGTKKPMTRVAVQFTQVKQRKTGEQIFSKWQIQMPYMDVKDNSVAHVYHSCHPFYDTVTKLYP